MSVEVKDGVLKVGFLVEPSKYVHKKYAEIKIIVERKAIKDTKIEFIHCVDPRKGHGMPPYVRQQQEFIFDTESSGSESSDFSDESDEEQEPEQKPLKPQSPKKELL